MLIYLDTCSIQRPFDDQSQLRIAMESEAVLRSLEFIERGDLRLVSSKVLEIEINQIPHRKRRFFSRGVLSLATQFIEIGPQIESRAREYKGVSISPFDALHLASAIEAGVDVFCTTDDQLLRKGRQVQTGDTRILTPIDFVESIER